MISDNSVDNNGNKNTANTQTPSHAPRTAAEAVAMMKGIAYEASAEEIRREQREQERIKAERAKEKEELERKKAEEEAAVLANLQLQNGNLFDRLKGGLQKTRDSFTGSLNAVFSGFTTIDDDFYDELEEILIMGDIGVKATEEILDDLREKVKEKKIKDPAQCRELLIEGIRNQMHSGQISYDFETRQSVVMVIGVNGVGKTTTVGKLASKLKASGRRVLMAAADTFRAAANEQLMEWSNRAGVEIISGAEGADPASVVYDAVAAAKARGADVLLCDTAGRLHNKKNLMEELKKINRIIDREFPDALRENLVVLDATTGQNALSQAREFANVCDLTGIILTKMDGTAKGGIAVAIQSELGIPVKYIGVGESIEDLQKFDADAFVQAIFEV